MWELLLCSSQRVKVELCSILSKFTHSLYKFGKFMSQPQISFLQFLQNISSSSVGSREKPWAARSARARAQPPVPTRAGHPQPGQVDFLNQICFDTCSQKSSRPWSSWVWKNWLHQKHCSQKEIKPWLQSQSKNQNNPPKASVYMCVDVINIAKHICLSPPQVNKYKEITNAPKHQLPAMKTLESAKYLQASWRESFCIVTQSQVASSSMQPNQTLFKFTSLT